MGIMVFSTTAIAIGYGFAVYDGPRADGSWLVRKMTSNGLALAVALRRADRFGA